jgi:nitrate reductase alpha subunit
MSHFLDRLTFFTRTPEEFSGGHGITTREDRRWEDGYRKRWQHDKVVRSTHGVNCTGSCSWKVYVGRDRHLGDPADRLSPHPAGAPEP